MPQESITNTSLNSSTPGSIKNKFAQNKVGTNASGWKSLLWSIVGHYGVLKFQNFYVDEHSFRQIVASVNWSSNTSQVITKVEEKFRDYTIYEKDSPDGPPIAYMEVKCNHSLTKEGGARLVRLVLKDIYDLAVYSQKNPKTDCYFMYIGTPESFEKLKWTSVPLSPEKAKIEKSYYENVLKPAAHKQYYGGSTLYEYHSHPFIRQNYKLPKKKLENRPKMNDALSFEFFAPPTDEGESTSAGLDDVGTPIRTMYKIRKKQQKDDKAKHKPEFFVGDPNTDLVEVVEKVPYTATKVADSFDDKRDLLCPLRVVVWQIRRPIFESDDRDIEDELLETVIDDLTVEQSSPPPSPQKEGQKKKKKKKKATTTNE